MRLIDGNKLVKDLKAMQKQFDAIALEGLIRGIEEQPTIEAEPVVRCKDCVCSSMLGDTLICERINNVMDGYYHGTVDVVKPDDYCNHGVQQKAKAILNGGVEDV